MRITTNLFVFITLLGLMAPTPINAQLQFIAHRGASYLAPENTVASINLAWELDSDGAECDIMLTKDKKIVVFHDSDMKRLLGREGRIAETNYHEFENLPIKLRDSNLTKYEGQYVPLLKDLLHTIPANKLLVIEIKCGKEIIAPLEEELRKHGHTGKIAFIAFDFETIIEAKKVFSKNECYYLSSDLVDVQNRFSEIIKSDLDGVNLNHKIIDQKLVDQFESYDKKVWCWTVNSKEDAEKMKEAGVKYITTDRPAWLKDTLSKQP